MKSGNALAFSRSILAATVDTGPTSFRIEAKEAERAALSEQLGLLGIDRLEADLRTSVVASGIRLEGTLWADVTQACVVTLEPVKASIEARFERIYSAEEKADDSLEIEVSLDEGEPWESLVDGKFDAGEAVAEQLALELDPFPRAPGVTFEGYSSEGEGKESAASGPFAALARLKGKPQ